MIIQLLGVIETKVKENPTLTSYVAGGSFTTWIASIISIVNPIVGCLAGIFGLVILYYTAAVKMEERRIQKENRKNAEVKTNLINKKFNVGDK